MTKGAQPGMVRGWIMLSDGGVLSLALRDQPLGCCFRLLKTQSNDWRLLLFAVLVPLGLLASYGQGWTA
jgi:hypothetical protein